MNAPCSDRGAWNFKRSREDWALPFYVRWVYIEGDVFYVLVQFLCFYICYERWLGE